MKRLSTVLGFMLSLSACPALAGSLLYSPDEKPTPVVIRMNMGGWMPHFIARAERYSKEGRRIIIDGDCRSACTFFLWTKFNIDVCATRNARIMFHKPSWRTGEGRFDVVTTPERVEWSNRRWDAILKEYPAPIARLVKDAPNPSEIGDSKAYVVLQGKQLEQHVKRCEYPMTGRTTRQR